jgi:hypothetical protein
MSSNPQASSAERMRRGASSGSEAPSLAPGPITPSDVRTLFAAVDIFRSLGGLEKAVAILDTTTKSNVEKIEQLFHKTDEMAFHIPILEKAIARHDKDLNELGRRHDKDLNELGKIAHTAKTLGAIALSGIGLAILAYIYHHLMQILVK